MFPPLLLLFLLVPAVELYLLIKIGSEIGVVATIALIVLTAILGASLTRAQGMRTLARYQQAMAEGRMPHAEVMDGLMILLAGAVLLTPGFLTDLAGFALLVPPVRSLVRRWIAARLKGRIHIVTGANHAGDPMKGSEKDVIEAEAEVIDVKAEPEPREGKR